MIHVDDNGYNDITIDNNLNSSQDDKKKAGLNSGFLLLLIKLTCQQKHIRLIKISGKTKN